MRKSIQKARIAARNYANLSANSQTEDDEEIEENPPIKQQQQLQSHQTLEQITPKRPRRLHALKIMYLAKTMNKAISDEDDDEVEVMVDESKIASHAVQTPPSSPVKGLNSSAVNRRQVH
uniref:Uncharacterized protein n=1 Tax=Glossina brevipalpis TaxID=37001 RepID=A0A1A9WAB5_9MUSC